MCCVVFTPAHCKYVCSFRPSSPLLNHCLLNQYKAIDAIDDANKKKNLLAAAGWTDATTALTKDTCKFIKNCPISASFRDFEAESNVSRCPQLGGWSPSSERPAQRSLPAAGHPTVSQWGRAWECWGEACRWRWGRESRRRC